MSLRLLFCAGVFFIFQNLSFGQKGNLVDGYVVLISGDTLFGKIKKLSPYALAEYVAFQKQDNDAQIKYYPAQLSKYYFEDSNYYVSDSVPFKKASEKVYFHRFFLKHLIEGTVDLYKLDYRMIENPSPLHEYQSKFYFMGSTEGGILIDLTERDYLAQFYSAFKEMKCTPKLSGKTNFNDEGLSSLIIAYNECLGKNSRKIYREPTKN
ncbi:MAG: hypothetical protein WAT91_01505 [Saprospiraceae bacterium]